VLDWNRLVIGHNRQHCAITAAGWNIVNKRYRHLLITSAMAERKQAVDRVRSPGRPSKPDITV
jgi:hypothetical protein